MLAAPTFSTTPTAVIYCEGQFGEQDGKTANGLVRSSEKYRILSVIDSTRAGQDAGTFLGEAPAGIPVVASLGEALTRSETLPDYLICGVAPATGVLSAEQRTVLLEGVSRGMHLINGLHQFLGEDPEFVAAAAAAQVTLTDVRKPKPKKDLRIFSGDIFDVTCPRIAILGTDGAIGKRTTTTILVKALRERGINAVMVGTGQTSIIQGGKYGVALDAIAPQYCSGEVESQVVAAFRNEQPDVIVVEGQGALSHPAYVSSAYILRGARPTHVILQHAPGRRTLGDYPTLPMPLVASEIALIEAFADTRVIGVTLNHEQLSPEAVQAAVAGIASDLGLPALDPLGAPADDLVEMVLRAIPSLRSKR